MNHSRWDRVRPAAGLVIVVLALTLAGAVPALAGGPHSGKYGIHVLIDNEEYAGAICQYNGTTLDAIKVGRPILYAYNRTGAVDTQSVDWRLNIQYRSTARTGAPGTTAPSAPPRPARRSTRTSRRAPTTW